MVQRGVNVDEVIRSIVDFPVFTFIYRTERGIVMGPVSAANGPGKHLFGHNTPLTLSGCFFKDRGKRISKKSEF